MNRPTLATRKARSATCPRGHALHGYNRKPDSADVASVGACRACITAHLWARRNNLFRDNPRVTTHAHDLYARYRDRDPTIPALENP